MAAAPDDLASLADVKSVEDALKRAIAEEATLTSQIEAMGHHFDGTSQELDDLELQARIRRVRDGGPGLDALAASAASLASDLEATSQAGAEATRPVRALDLAHSRAKAALERVDDVLDLQQCLGSIRQAMRSGDYLVAATTCKRYHAVEKVLPVSEADRKTMEEAEEQLVQIVHKKFDEAVKMQNMAEVTECGQLMTLLGQGGKGLGQYLQFLENQLRSDAEAVRVADSSGPDDPGVAVNTLSTVFQKAAASLEEAERVATKNFGAEGPARVLASVSAVIGEIAGAVVAQFVNSSRIKTALESRSLFMDASLFEVNLEEPSDDVPLTTFALDALLDEMALVSQRCVSFLRLINGKATYLDSVARRRRDSDHAVKTAAERVSARADLPLAIGELAGVYTSLEEAFLIYSTRKAIQIDEIDEDLTSSCVEDVFYILQKGANRAVATGETNSTCSVINHATAILNEYLYRELAVRVGQIGRNKDEVLDTTREAQYEDMMAALAERFPHVQNSTGAAQASALNISIASIASAGVASPGPVPTTDASEGFESEFASLLSPESAFWCVTINNLEAAAANVQKLRSGIQGEIDVVFSDVMEREKISSCMSEFSTVQSDMKKRLSAGTTKLCASLSPRLRGAVSFMEGQSAIINYELSEEGFASIQSSNPFQDFIGTLSSILGPYKASLSENMHRLMMFKVAGFLCKQLETAIRRRKLTELGAMQFDRDVRSLQTFFVTRASHSIREKFLRLAQTAAVLSADSQEEVNDLAKAADWQLSDSDTTALLALRVDQGSTT